MSRFVGGQNTVHPGGGAPQSPQVGAGGLLHLEGRISQEIVDLGQGVGRELLRFVFELAVRMAGELGCIGVLVDAKPGAVEFYRRYGFVAIEVLEGESGARPAPTIMFLPLAEIAAAKGE